MHVREFEKALQRADIENGKSGLISLPYWDFAIPLGPDNEFVPQVIRRELSTFPPKYLRLHQKCKKLLDRNALGLPSDGELKKSLHNHRSSVVTDISEMLEAPLFQEFASTSTSR
jgi:hypothetical protein